MQAIKPTALLACVLLSVSAHGLLLSQSQSSGARKAPAAAAVGVRVAPVAQEAPAQPATEPADAAAPVQLALPSNTSGPSLLQAPSLASQRTEPQAAVFASLQDEDEDGYIPRPRLTQPPVLQQPVLLVWPEQGGADGQHTAQLSLFIDDEGVVRRVRVDSDGLPPVFQLQVRQAFMGARFYPGELDGRVVKSRVRVEVTFDGEAQVQPRGLRP